MTRRDRQRPLPIWRAREVWEERWPREAQGLGSTLGSAGWTGLQPAMFTRSGAASGRPVGGRRVLQRDGALGTCAERARAREGYPQPKRRLGISASRARNQEGAKEGKHPAAHALSGPPGLRPSSPHLLQPHSSLAHLPALPFCVYPRVSASPAAGIPPIGGSTFELKPQSLSSHAPTVAARRSPISRRVGP